MLYDYSSDRAITRRASSGSIPLYPGNPSDVYDHAGRLTGGFSTNSEVEGFAYDVQDHLKVIRTNGAVTQLLEYGPAGEILYRKEGTKVYFYVGDQATVTADVPAGCTGYGGSNCTVSNVKVGVHVSVGARVATVKAATGTGADTIGDVLYYHRDVRGSVVATTLTGGGIGVKYRYGPYGAESKKAVTNSSGESELGFTGGLKLTTHASDLLVDGKLILLGARVYHVDLRRWIQADTVDPLRYTYANGDPVNLTDPSGRRPISEWFGNHSLSLSDYNLASLNGLYDSIDLPRLSNAAYANARAVAYGQGSAADAEPNDSADLSIQMPGLGDGSTSLGGWASGLALEHPTMLADNSVLAVKTLLTNAVWNTELAVCDAVTGVASGVSLGGTDTLMAGNTLVRTNSFGHQVGAAFGTALLIGASVGVAAPLIPALTPATATGAAAAGGGALVRMADAAYEGSSRIVAGYRLAGTSGVAGDTYSVNVWGLYATDKAQGIGRLVNSLKSEAVAAGASTISITGNAIINQGIMRAGAIASRFGLTFTKVNDSTILLQGPVK